MTVLARALLVFGLLLHADPAMAHPPPLGIPGFFGGLLHPLFVPAHVLAMLGLALLIGQQGWGRASPFGYVVALVAGLGVIALGFVPMAAGEALLAIAAATGVLVALARPLPEAAGVLLAVATAAAIGLDSPPEVLSLREANLMLIGTGFGATLALIVAVECASRLHLGWQRIGARVLGSWIAAIALLVLALQWRTAV